MAHRWQVARLLEQGLPYLEIARADGRVDDDGDARGALAAPRRGRLPGSARPRGLLRVAVPVEGPAARAVVPPARGRRARARAAGRPRARVPVPQRAGRGAARARGRRARVRAGRRRRLRDHRHRSRARARRRRARAAAARLRLVPARGGGARGVERRSRSPTSPARRVATVYPRLARELLPVDVTLVDVTGSVEIAPRLGLADAIVDLVSSGQHAAHERAALARRAARVRGGARRARRGRSRRRSRRCCARSSRRAAHRYVMLNAPSRRCPRSARSSRRACRACCRSPSREWSPCTRSSRPPRSGACCRELEAAGGSSILIVPVERMAA